MSVDWSYFGNNTFRRITDDYLPATGEGNNAAQQAVTAVTKLVYKWYNDGDVYDNQYGLAGWWNDLSSYANWLHKYAGHVEASGRTVSELLESIYGIRSKGSYEDLLKELADHILDLDTLEELTKKYEGTTQGSIYSCEGPFKFVEGAEEDEEDEYEEDDEYEDDEEW